MYDNFKFFINYRDWSANMEVYLVQDDKINNSRVFVTLENGQFLETQTVIGKEVKPLFVLPFGLADEFMQAMAELLHKHGFKAKGQPVLQNEIDAVKYHLEDMRKLVFDNG